jgi:hypothetical protein
VFKWETGLKHRVFSSSSLTFVVAVQRRAALVDGVFSLFLLQTRKLLSSFLGVVLRVVVVARLVFGEFAEIVPTSSFAGGRPARQLSVTLRSS